ncbi:MAG: LacI family DNA-binding transcriptional regulator [Rhizobiaceae bacterium]|nr:LacI family DNA-binding transcriptional regulator [Rhizobiaceae bacterium]
MKRPNVTSVDVARLAGVSQSAVSRAFSKVPTQSSVSDETRKKILRAADELGYRPNALARSLITQRTRIVGVLFSYLDNPFYANALELICHGLQRQGYHALVFMMPDTLADVEATVSDILQYQVDGLITASVELSSKLCEDCREQGIPVVMLNRVQDNPLLSSVTTDNVGGGRLAAGALVSAGCKRIGLIAGWEGASTSRDREFGFTAELAARGIELFSRAVGHFDLVRTEEATREMFDRPAAARPDGVFVVNDYMAVRAMDVMRFGLGLRIPQDVSVVGFDDTAMADLPTYALTTVRQPVRQMVDSALRLLFERLNQTGVEPEHVILGARLMERESVRNRTP